MNASDINPDFYEGPNPDNWDGRVDSENDFNLFRFHQVVHYSSVNELRDEENYALLGFASDEGVRRNKGRVGAAAGPDYFRKTIGSLCWHGPEKGFVDVGNIFPNNGDLETGQQELGKAVYRLLAHHKKPHVIGGGHETAFGHYLGIARYLAENEADAKLGILNIDAHFDLRSYQGAASSGTPFLQALEHAGAQGIDLKYFVYGINPHNNTRALFNTAADWGVDYCTNRQIFDDENEALAKAAAFIQSRSHIYLTVCLDVFKAETAPGVSAPAWNGIGLNHALKVLDLVKKSGKLISMDTCELNPEYDENQKTAKLAGMLFSERIA